MRLLDRGHIGEAHRRAGRRGLHHKLAQPVEVVHLRAHQAQDQLVVGRVEAGRVHDVRSVDGVDQIGDRHSRCLQQRRVGHHVKLRHLPALHQHRADAVDAIERRLQVVGGDLPELRLRNGVGGEAVAEDGKAGKGEPVGGDARRGRQRLLHLGQRRVHQLQRLHHVDIPVEEQAHFGRAAAGGGAHGLKAGNGVDRVLDGLRDGHFHLLDRHHAVVHADHDARKVGLGKDRDGHLEGQVDARHREQDGEEEDGARGPRQPERLLG